MRRHLLALPFLFLIGCGIPKDQYDAAVADANAQKTQRAALEQHITELDKQIADLQKENGEFKLKVSDAENVMKKQGLELTELAELRRQKQAAEARAKLFDDLVAKLRKMTDAGKMSVAIRRGQIVLALDTDVLFDPGKPELKKEGQAEIAEVAKVLATLQGRRFQVAGHTDNAPIRTSQFPSNWELSTARALTVTKLLAKEGVPNEQLSAAGYAEFDPAESNATPQGKAKNRRIEIVLVPNVEELGLQKLANK